MPSFFFMFFVIFSFLFIQGCQPAAANESPDSIGNVTIFIYHKFGEEKYPTTNVAVDRFAEQLQYLQNNNFKVLSLSALVDLLEKKGTLPEKTAVITIDDGYASTYTEAWPLLRKFGFPFTVFLYVEAVDKKYRNFLTWEQISEMQNVGVDFQDHGYSHYRFGSIPPTMDENAYRTWIKGDLAKGNDILAKRLGKKPLFLALPYGEYNSIVQEVTQDLGYKAVFTQDPGSVSRFTNLFSIPREPILGTDWSSMDHFAQVLARKDLPVSDPHPSSAPLADTHPVSFCATIINPHLYKEESFGIYVSELGWQKASLSDNRLCIKNSTTLKRRSNRVAISATEKGRGASAMHYWLLINSDKSEQEH